MVSCNKDNSSGSINKSGEQVSVSFIADLREGVTKAVDDGDGAGINADQCKLQIWMGNVLSFEKTVPVSSFEAKFENIILMKNQKYDFLFWADNHAGAYYVTDTLTKVSLKGSYIGGDDRRDAFYASVNDTTFEDGFSQEVILHRPFAQLNVIATNIPDLYEQFPDISQLASVLPDKIGVKVTVPTIFNVKTGVASVPAELSYVSSMYTSPIRTDSGSRNTLSMDYFLATPEGNLVDVGFSAGYRTSDHSDISYSFTNVPLRRNYRTNIIGSFISVQGEVTVVVSPMWTGTIEKDY